MLGLALAATACDIVDLASSSSPILEQTWSVPTEGTSITVASLLPPNVSICCGTPSDNSGFLVDVATISITRRVGDDCGSCNTLNGTNAIKPAFVLASGNTQALPQDVAAVSILNGTLTVSLTNNMSFDPLYVRTAPPPQTQGFMLLVVRSGSLVLGRDSVRGAAVASPDGKNSPFGPGSTLTRTIPLTTGNVTGNLSVDVTINSPQGDHNEFINANGTLGASATLRDVTAQPTLKVGSVSMNVVNRNMLSVVGDSLPLDDMKDVADHIVSAALEMTIDNPFTVTGTVNVSFGYAPGQAITKSVTMPSGVGVVSVSLNSTEIQTLMGKKVALSISGTVNSAAPITVTPSQAVTVANRLILVIQVGG